MKMILTACLSLLLISTGCATAQNEPQFSVEPAIFSEQELDQILAPIALYPDTVLAHILIAATYPLEVVQAARWAEKNPGLEGDQALQAVEAEDWDPSVKALAAFPAILQRMSDDLDWTQRLGDAFLDDEERITARIQNLRQHAYDAGNLDSLEHLNVVREQETIIIEPAVREVVYVPYYDTRYVYGSWWWDNHPPVYWHHPHHQNSYVSFYWGPRISLSASFFFSGFNWHNHHLVVLDRHDVRPHDYYSRRQIIDHDDSHRWQHNPRHRRGVDYHNPRTRDYFEKRTRNTSAVTTVGTRSSSSDSQTRSTRQYDKRNPGVKTDNTNRNADYVREQLRDRPNVRAQQSRDVDSRTAGQTSTRNSKDNSASREDRQQRVEQKRSATDRGNIKLREQDSAPTGPKRSTDARVRRSDQGDVKRNNQGENSDRQNRSNGSQQKQQPAPAKNSSRSDKKSSERSNSKRGSGERDSTRSSRSERSFKRDR